MWVHRGMVWGEEVCDCLIVVWECQNNWHYIQKIYIYKDKTKNRQTLLHKWIQPHSTIYNDNYIPSQQLMIHKFEFDLTSYHNNPVQCFFYLYITWVDEFYIALLIIIVQNL